MKPHSSLPYVFCNCALLLIAVVAAMKSNPLLAQYEPMLQKNIQWFGSYSYSNQATFEGRGHSFVGLLKNDTTINDSTFYEYWEYKISEYYNGPGGNFDTTYHTNYPASFMGYFYEDTTRQKVYRTYNNRSQLYLLWDFDVQAGDTLQHHHAEVYVDSVGTITDSLGDTRRIYFISANGGTPIESDECPNNYRNCGIYIEGIGAYGSTGGGMAHDFNYTLNGPPYQSYYLNCFSKNGNQVVGDGNCWHTLNIEAFSEAKHPRFFPNPVQNTLNLELPHQGRVVLTDLSGKTIWKKQLQPGLHAINTTDLPKGIYLLEYQSKKGLLWNQRLVK